MCEDARVTSSPAHFTRCDSGDFQPTTFAQSHWGDDHLSGPAVVGLAAQALEAEYGSPEFLPARLTVDLFKVARTVPTRTVLRCVRDGHRVRNTECDVIQHDVVVARATLASYRTSAPPAGREWTAATGFVAPMQRDDAVWTFVGSDAAGWSTTPGDHQNLSRKRFYHRGVPVVAGAKLTPFVRAAMVAEGTSLVTNLGTHGVGYINGDVTVGLARLPIGEWIGVQADTHWAEDGVAVGTATLYDDAGPFGSGMVTAIANPAAQIDFTGVTFPVQRSANGDHSPSCDGRAG